MDMPRLVVFTKGDKVPRGRAKGLYQKYMSGGMVSVTPPPVTCGRNDSAVDGVRDLLPRIIDELGKL
jgi:GTP-binding protein